MRAPAGRMAGSSGSKPKPSVRTPYCLRMGFAGFVLAEVPTGLRGAADAEDVEDGLHARRRVAVGGLAVEQFADAAAGEFVGERLGGGFEDLEAAPGEIDDTDGGGRVVALAGEADGGERAGGVQFQQRHKSTSVPGVRTRVTAKADDGALRGIRGVLRLLADGDAEARVQQFAEIRLELVMSMPAIGTPSVRREREADGLGDLHRIVVEHLVEVADAEEEDAIRGCCRLKPRVLTHRGSVAGVGHGGEGEAVVRRQWAAGGKKRKGD